MVLIVIMILKRNPHKYAMKVYIFLDEYFINKINEVVFKVHLITKV